jgi:hypothetical protein
MVNCIKVWNNRQIRIRDDRYVNLTDLAQASGKLFADWKRLKSTESYLTTLSGIMGIPIVGLISSNVGGTPETTGTWGHPKVAIRFAQWCSDEFAVQVDFWIDELLVTGTVSLPHYADNWDNPEWQKDRQIGKGKRLTLTDATKAWIARRKAEGIKFTKAQEGKLFASHSNALNRGVYGRSAQELRDTLGISKNDLLRDYFPQDELWAIQTVEDAAAWLVHSKDMNPIEAVNRVIESIEYTRRFIKRHKEPLPPSRAKKQLKAPGQLSLF